MTENKEEKFCKEENPLDEVIEILRSYEKETLPRNSQECLTCEHQH